MKALYISYDGMTDPLGQSQVLPYLQGLSADVEFTLVSFEKKERLQNAPVVKKILENAGIEWHPQMYTKKPPVLSTLWDIWKMRRVCFGLHREKNFQVVHCRSYIAALVGLEMKKKFGTCFIFDMRGFWADERVDGGLWDVKNPLYKSIYDFFKKKEKQFFEEADQIISLTHAAAEKIESWEELKIKNRVEVIPCCSDLELFNSASVSKAAKADARTKANLSGDEFVLSYIGSLGTWYMLNEMMHFFKRFLLKKKNAVFLIVTQDDASIVFQAAEKMDVPKENIRVVRAARNEVPGFISISHVSIFFIKPVFSKIASSPTKQGEIMAMGIPLICNAHIGDTDKVIKKYDAGWIVENFTEEEFDMVAEKVLTETKDKNLIIKGAHEFYALETGVDTYRSIYLKLNTSCR